MLGNSSQQPELGHFTLEWALNSSFHWFIRGSWEGEKRNVAEREVSRSLAVSGGLGSHAGPLPTRSPLPTTQSCVFCRLLVPPEHLPCSQPGWGINQARSSLGDLTTPHFIRSVNHPPPPTPCPRSPDKLLGALSTLEIKLHNSRGNKSTSPLCSLIISQTRGGCESLSGNDTGKGRFVEGPDPHQGFVGCSVMPCTPTEGTEEPRSC